MAFSIVVFVILGSVLEGIPAHRAVRAAAVPDRAAMGVHEVHYSMVVILAMGIGLFAPPFGVGFYAACAIGTSPDEAMARDRGPISARCWSARSSSPRFPGCRSDSCNSPDGAIRVQLGYFESQPTMLLAELGDDNKVFGLGEPLQGALGLDPEPRALLLPCRNTIIGTARSIQRAYHRLQFVRLDTQRILCALETGLPSPYMIFRCQRLALLKYRTIALARN